jgi:uroporphyrinogen-III synthase
MADGPRPAPISNSECDTLAWPDGMTVVGSAAVGHSYRMTHPSVAFRTNKGGAVLITRPEPGASDTAARVAAMGLVPVVASLLAIRPIPIRVAAEQFAAVLLASGNAVNALSELRRTVQVLTVGAATARRAEKAGFTKVASADGDAVALAALVHARFRPSDGPLLLAVGRGQGLALAANLRRSGYRVTRRVAYDTIPVARLPEAAKTALLDHRTRTVLLFSAETARHFVRLVRRAGLLVALASREAITIGPQAAMALKEVPWARIRVAAKPTQEDMLALLQ